MKRLDAIEAKSIRQKYLEEKFPNLAFVAKVNLAESCIYAGQMTLKFITKENQSEAKKRINHLRDLHGLTGKEIMKIPNKSKLWFIMSKFSFWGTCWIKNRLNRGF